MRLIIGIIIAFIVAIFIYMLNPIVGFVGILLVLIFANASKSIIKGHLGEYQIQKILQQLGPDYIIYGDIYVKKDEEFTQLDHIVLSKFGIFVIETKNYQGWIFGNDNQKFWTQVIYKRKERFLNPIWQNKGHIKALEAYLDYQYSIFNIVTFTNKAEFKFKHEFTSAYVINAKNLPNTIKSNTTIVLSESEIVSLRNKIEALLVEPKEKRKIQKLHLKQLSEKTSLAKEAKPSKNIIKAS